MKKVETDRESALDRLTGDALRAHMSPVSEVSDTSDTRRCLDADTLAAWEEQTLSARERAAVEAHAAGCARCQAMLAAMARTTPAPVAAPWWRVHLMAWLVPVSAAAAALVVWMALPLRMAIESRQPAAQTAGAPPAAPANPPAIARAEPPPFAPPSPELGEKPAGKQPPKADALRDARGGNRGVEQGGAQRMEFRRTDVNEKPPASALAKTEMAAAEPKAADRAAAASPPPEAAPVPPPAAAAPTPAAVAGAVVQERAAGTVAPRAELDRLASRVAVAPAVSIVSPNPLIRWRPVAGGAVEHSTDGGSTWQTQQTGQTTTLTAGASPAPLICWLVGPRGRVVLSTDGATWKPVPLADPIDLVSIRATDEKTAIVTASDGRTFATTDGGATWTPR